MKTVLITGAAGFLGFHLCERFLSEGYQVIAVDNFCTGSRLHKTVLESRNTQEQKIIFVEADIIRPWGEWTGSVPSSWIKSLQYILHFASPASPAHYIAYSLETMAANSTGLQHALAMADSVKGRVVFASTSEVYGSSSERVQVETSWGQVNSFGERSCYQEAKRFGEALIFSHNKRFNTSHGLVRIFNTYGPRMNPEDGRVVINFLMQALKGEALTVYGEGLQTRSFCYVTDLIEAIYRYTRTDITVPVNIGNPEELTVLGLAKTVRELFPEKKLDLIFKALPQEDPLQRCPDISKAHSLLDGWKPQVSLREGLQLMKNWYEQAEQT